MDFKKKLLEKPLKKGKESPGGWHTTSNRRNDGASVNEGGDGSARHVWGNQKRCVSPHSGVKSLRSKSNNDDGRTNVTGGGAIHSPKSSPLHSERKQRIQTSNTLSKTESIKQADGEKNAS